MATSGTIEKKFHGGSSGGYYFGIDWKVNSQSTANNSSNVTASVFIRSTGNGYSINSSATKNITLTINGTSYSGTATVGIGTNTKKTLLTKTVDVKHNSDGTKTCAFACSGVLGLTLSGTYYGTVSHSGNGTFNTINLNTAPTWTTDDTRMKIGSTEIKANVIIPENTSSVSVISAQATDAETPNGLNYYLHRHINGSYSAQIKAGGTSLTGTDDISSWGQGTQIKYEAKVSDGSLWASSSRWSWVYTKNTFTRASVTSIGSIGVNSTGVSFTATGIKNSGGGNGYVNTSFGYRIESLTSGVNIHGENTTYQNNQNNVAFTLGIKNNGGSPTNPHWLDANELRAAFRNSNYTGTLKLRLVSWNSYGSQGYVDFNVSVDLRKAAPSTTVKYATNNKITHSGTDYYIPAHLPFVVSWNAVNDTVEGSACTYDIYYQVGSGSLKHLGSTTGTSYTAYLGGTEIGNNKTTNFKIVVRVKTKYGTTTDCSGATITLWDYAPPTVRVSGVTRESANVILTGTITINTSIPNVTLTNTRWRWVGGSNTNFKVTNSSNEKIKNFTLTAPAAQDLTGTIHIESSDTARDLIANIVTMSLGNTEVAVKGYMPVISLTKNGVGVNTRPLSGYKFSVDGNAKINGNLATNGLTLSSLTVSGTTNLNGTNNLNGTTNLKATVVNGDVKLKSPNGTWTGDFIKRYEGDANGMGVAIQTGGRIVIGGGESAVTFMNGIGSPAGEVLHLTSDNNVEIVSNMQNGYANRKTLTFSNDGQLSFPQGGYITLPDNRGSWLNGATNASLRSPAKQTTGSYHSLLAQTTSSGHKISLGGLGDNFGFHVYDAGRTENGLDRYFRVNLANKTVDTDMRFVVNSEWIYTTGNTGWYNSTYAGGWYMSDSTWLRAYNDKSIYTYNTMKCGTMVCKILDDFIGTANSCHVDNANGANSQITLRPDTDNRGNLGHRNFTWNYANITSIGNAYSIDRNSTYNVTRFNNNDMMYDMVKNMNFYLEKEKSVDEFEEEIKLKQTEEYINADEETQKQMLRNIKKVTPASYHYSKRTKLVANAEELPFEVAPETHMADGSRTIEVGAFMTGLACALQKAIEKIETLESKIEELKNN